VTLTYGTSAAQFNNGRLITLTDGVGSENYTYSILGQMTQLQKVISGTTYTTAYAYNLTSELTQITYPSGRAVQQNIDPVGRLSSVVGTLNSVNTTYASGFTYNPASQLTGLQYGNNLFASFGFSPDRLQVNCLDYSTTNRNGTCAHDSTTRFGLTYSYGAAGSNNSQIASITDSVDSGRTATYTYDSLYRLSRAVTTGSTNYPAWGLSETYDRYANRSAQSIYSGCVAPMSCPTNSVTTDATTNRISGSPYAYDASGNMTNDGLNTLTYDGENRAVSATNGASSGTYAYDGNDLRVKKVSGSTAMVYIFSGSKVIAEYLNGAAPSSPTTEYIYSGSTLLAKIDSSGAKYYHQDHLSNRLITDSSGNTLAQMGHFAFGESWYNASNDKLIFTTYERDSESGNDYAMARYYVSRLGRFNSPDQLAGSTGNPQSLNRYAYVLNNPVNLVDPLGLSTGGGCLILRNLEPTSPEEVAGGYWHEDALDFSSEAEPPPPQPNCGFGGGGGGGGDCWVIIDGGQAPCELAGSGEANAICPNNDCSVFTQPFTGQNGQQYSIVPTANGLHWADAFGNEITSNDTLISAGLGPLDEVFWPFTGGGPGGNSSGSGIPSTADIIKNLKSCLAALYNVRSPTTLTFTPSSPGSNGYFYGVNAGVGVAIENDVGSYTSKSLKQAFDPLHLHGDFVGITRPFSPNVNYTASDLSPVEMLMTQIHELGHSLDIITSQNPFGSSEASAYTFQNCVLETLGLFENH
jgi:RHS repeat-associated protein